MEKPKKVTPLAIERVEPDNRRIAFWADTPLAESLREYGTLFRANGNFWLLTVDSRYVFTEVQEYLDSLDTSLETPTGDATN